MASIIQTAENAASNTVLKKFQAKDPCSAYVIWKIPAIVLIAFIGMIIKYLGAIIKHVLSNSSHAYTTATWFIAFAFQLGIGFLLQEFLKIRNMWKNPF